MDGPRALPAWLIFLLVALGVAFAVGIALLLTQLDSLQRRTLLPQVTLPAVDQDATAAAAAVTVVVVGGGDSPTATASSTVTPTALSADETAITETSAAVLIPTCAAAPTGWVPYIVQDGDTAASLAFSYGISVLTLTQANCLTHEQLTPGQIILVPAVTQTPAAEEVVCAAPAGWIQHVVGQDESLSGLAKEHMISVLTLMQANCLEIPAITPGRIIFLPPAMPAVSASPTMMMPRPPARRTPMWPPVVRPSPTRIWRPPRPTATSTRAIVTQPTATKRPTLVSSATVSSTPTSMPSATAQPTVTPSVTATTTSLPTATFTATVATSPTATSTSAAPTITATSEDGYPGKETLPTATATATTTATAAAYP